MNNFKFIVLLATILGSSTLFAQVYDVNFAPLNFGTTTTNGASTPPLIITRTGQTLSTSSAYNATTANTAGTQVLYRNIITIGSQVIDCIVTNVDGSVIFDETGTNADVNQMLVPTVFVSNANAFKDFLFEFVVSTSVGSNTVFEPVILDNVVLNVYDIDRDAGISGTGQNKNSLKISTENMTFSQVLSTQAAVNSSNPSFWEVYHSTTSSNNSDNINNFTSVVGDNNRIRCTFSGMTSLLIELGAQNTQGDPIWSSSSRFYLAFSPGANFTGTIVNTPNNIVVDLNANGTADGVSNTVSINSNNPSNFTLTGTNITKTTATTLTGVNVSYPVSGIINRSNETMIINGANGTSLVIPLAFNTAPSPSTFTLLVNSNTVTYNISYTVSINNSGDTINTIRFTESTMDLAKAEVLLDALQYRNASIAGNEVGFRNFTVIGTGTILFGGQTVNISSPPAIFTANIPVPLPVNVISFTGKALENANQLNWTVAQEVDFSHYEVLRSDDGRAFNTVGTVFATENNMDMKSYSFVDASATSEVSYYKLRLVDNNGSVAYTSLVVVSRNAIVPTVSNLFPNPATTQVNIEVQGVSVDNFNISVQDINGKIVYQANQVSAMSNVYQMDVTNFNRGVYVIRIEDEMGNVSVSRFAVSK